MEMTTPKVVRDKLNELNAIAEKYPDSIPITPLAKFLNAKKQGLRDYIESGKCPYGFAWQSEVATKTVKGKKVGTHLGRKVYKVPTAKFYAWYAKDLLELCNNVDNVENGQSVHDSEVLEFQSV